MWHYVQSLFKETFAPQVIVNLAAGTAVGVVFVLLYQRHYDQDVKKRSVAHEQKRRQTILKLGSQNLNPGQLPQLGTVPAVSSADHHCWTTTEEVEWLDRYAEDIWPNFQRYMRDLVKRTIEPALKHALPGMIRDSVSFTNVELGTATPHFGPLVVKTLGNSDGFIELQIGVVLDSNLEVDLVAVGVPIGVSSLRLDGVLSLVFGPPMERPPFFGGIEIFMSEAPRLSIEFSGAGRVTHLPVLRQAILKVVSNAIRHVMVLPNRIAVDLNPDDDVDFAELRCPEPDHVLRLTLDRGEKLVASDFSFFKAPTSDPYVVISFGDHEWTSKIAYANLNPTWGESVDFLVHCESQLAKFEVWDKDAYTSDELIGLNHGVPLTSLQVTAGETCRVCEVPLTSEDGKSKAGKLFVTAEFLRLTDDPRAAVKEGPLVAFLAAKVKEVKGLPTNSNFPFQVRVVACGVEGMTKGSFATPDSRVTHAMQDICMTLASKGKWTPERIAEVLAMDKNQVHNFLADHGSRESQRVFLDCMDMRHATNPQIEQIVQFLIPDPSLEGSLVRLELLDKHKHVIASCEVSMSDILLAEGTKLSKNFLLVPPQLDPESMIASVGDTHHAEQIELVGKLYIRWLRRAT